MAAPLFTIPLWMDLTAVAIGAIQGAMFAARLTERRIDLLGVALIGVIIALDAVTIGLFGAIGTSKALAYGVPVVPAVFVGVLAAVGGSILRDVALNLPIAVMHVGSLYAVAATAGTVLLVVLASFDVNIVVAGTACVIVTTLTRLGSVRFGWSLPEQRALGSWKVWRRA